MGSTGHRFGPAGRGWLAFLGRGALLLCLAACAPLPDGTRSEGPRPGFPFAARWQGPVPAARGTAGSPLADSGLWWQAFRDPALDRLMALALAGSPTLAAARARAEAASRAAAAVPGAVTLPGGASLRGSDAGNAPGQVRAAADAGFELLFDPGRGRAADRAAAAAGAALAAAEARGARLFLTGEVAGAYIDLRLAQRRLSLAGAEAARRRQTLALAGTLAEAGAATRVDTLRSEGRLAEIAADLPGLAAAAAAAEARLAVLAGQSPGTLPPDLAAALSARGGQPRATLAPDPGIPADLLRNRPDLAAAGAAYDAARAELGQARALLWPRLSLSGTIEASGKVGGGGRTGGASLGPALRLPALPAGPARAGVAAREARVAAAHADWTAAVLAALLEVETALLDYRAAAGAEAAAARATGLYAETALAEARAARARAYVALMIRLGAGGESPPPPPG